MVLPLRYKMLGKWDRWYAGCTEASPYVDTETYRRGADFLQCCDTIEDWGCGMGWLRQFIPQGYVGIDGSHGHFVDVVADLRTYRSSVDGIFMRHVLEHNYEWQPILENAMASFLRRFVLITFTPFGDVTREISYEADPGVPSISFAKRDLTVFFDELKWYEESFSNGTQFGTETVFYVER